MNQVNKHLADMSMDSANSKQRVRVVGRQTEDFDDGRSEASYTSSSYQVGFGQTNQSHLSSALKQPPVFQNAHDISSSASQISYEDGF